MIFQEDIELVSKKAMGIFGPNGRMIEKTKNSMFNVTILTKSHGRLWYGDLDLVGDMEKLDAFRTTMKEPVYVLSDGEWSPDMAILVC